VEVFLRQEISGIGIENGAVLQNNPYVVFSTVNGDDANSGNWGYGYILEYVGYARAAPYTYWKGEIVSLEDGYVQHIDPVLERYIVGPISQGEYPDLKQPSSVTGLNLGDYQPENPTWAYGGKLDVVPIQGWNPNNK